MVIEVQQARYIRQSKLPGAVLAEQLRDMGKLRQFCVQCFSVTNAVVCYSISL